MEAIMTAVTAGLTPTVIMGTIGQLVPYLIIIVPVAFGIYELRKLIKGTAKGKVQF